MRGFQSFVCKGSISLAAALAAASSAQADVALSAAGVSTNMGSEWLSIDQAINQSGLSPHYVSGTTDFATYVSGNTHYSAFGTTWLSGNGTITGNVDFDLGSTHMIGGMAMWANGQPSGLVLEYVQNFQLYASDDAAFTSPTLLGSFTLNTTYGNDNDTGHAFSFSPVTTQYVRMVILSNHGSVSNTCIDEVVFNQVPSPAAAALLGMGGLFASRRRRA